MAAGAAHLDAPESVCELAKRAGGPDEDLKREEVLLILDPLRTRTRETTRETMRETRPWGVE